MTERDRDDLLSAASDRFDRRLSDESGKLRTEIGGLRVDMVKQGSEIRLEIANLRLNMSQQFGASREQFAIFKSDAEEKHRDLLKWALVFWVGSKVVRRWRAKGAV